MNAPAETDVSASSDSTGLYGHVRFVEVDKTVDVVNTRQVGHLRPLRKISKTSLCQLVNRRCQALVTQRYLLSHRFRDDFAHVFDDKPA